MLIITITCAVALFLTILNSLTIKVVKNHPNQIAQKVCVLIPMRNEAANVIGCIDSIIAQQGLLDFEVIVLNDNSTDETALKLNNYPNIKVINGEQLPNGWLGKLWACHQLSQAAKGEILVFLDADVRLTENAISSAIGKMGNWQFISPYPKQLSVGVLEKIFQPLLHWSWLSSVPLRLAQRLGIKSMSVANGQFFIIEADAYKKSGGHDGVKNEVLDDLALSKALLAKGFKGGVAEGSQVSSCTMYQSFNDLVRGYQKSLWSAFGGIAGSIFVCLLLLATGVVTIIFALAGSKLAATGFLLIYVSRIISSIRSGESAVTAIAHPIAILIFIYISIISWIGKLSGTLTWRDRVIS